MSGAAQKRSAVAVNERVMHSSLALTATRPQSGRERVDIEPVLLEPMARLAQLALGEQGTESRQQHMSLHAELKAARLPQGGETI
jgi:hypothetical protein